MAGSPARRPGARRPRSGSARPGSGCAPGQPRMGQRVAGPGVAAGTGRADLCCTSQRGPSRVLVGDRSLPRPVLWLPTGYLVIQVRVGWSRSPIAPTAAWRRRRRYAQRTEAFTPSARAIPEPEPECRRSRGCLPISPTLCLGTRCSRGFGRGATTVDRRLAATRRRQRSCAAGEPVGRRPIRDDSFRCRCAGWPGCAAQGGSVVVARSVPGGSCCGRFRKRP